MKIGDLIEVEWLDASIDTGDANSRDYDAATQLTRTIGYLLQLGRVNLCLAHECSPESDTENIYRCMTRIPRACVRRVWQLSRGRQGSSTAKAP